MPRSGVKNESTGVESSLTVVEGRPVAGSRPRTAPLSIRTMTLQDVPEVSELERRVFADPWSVDSFLSEVERRPDVGHPLVVRDAADALVAYSVVWFIVDEVHIGNIAVSPDRQGQGVGAFLLRHILSQGRRRGFTLATLEVRPSNVPALRLYERFGFRRIAIRKRYYRNDGEDAHVLACALEPRKEASVG